MSNLSLYNITNQFVDIMEKVQDGELTEEEYNKLGEELALELQNKSTSIIGYTKNVEAYINAIKDEEVRLSNMRKLAENKLTKFKEYVKENMEKLGINKIETDLGKLSITNNPISVEVLNQEIIPEKFLTQKVTITPDKTAIKNHFKETGEVISGIRIVDDKTSLRIK